jgi:hypothetical protein
MSDPYDTDIAAWAELQADAPRRRATNEIDWNNVVEEIADVAARHKDQIEGRLSVLCEHLLKRQFQPEMRSGSWRGSVAEARDRIASLIRKNPSLQDYPASVLAEACPPGRRKAEAEGGAGARDVPLDHRATARSRVLAVTGRSRGSVRVVTARA